jgi:hypothetical protein
VREEFVASISRESVPLERVARFSSRIVVGSVLEKTSFRFPGSPEHLPQPEGSALRCFRIRAVKTLKGPEFPVGGELWVFSSSEWFQHTHAEVLKDGVISYSDSRYSGGIPAEQIQTGTDVLFFLTENPAPSGFPPGAVFMGFDGGHDRAAREEGVVKALREGSSVGFDHHVRVSKSIPAQFPDHLEIRFICHSHKRPMVGGPTKEWIDLELSKDGQTASMSLSHRTDPESGETWDTETWGGYSIEVKDMAVEWAALVVRRSPAE